jgi:hypothetical protein
VRVELGKARCRFHGGFSRGQKTEAGRARIAEAQRRRWEAYREGRYERAVYRPIKGSPGAFIGIVEAPDETSALKAAIEEFAIINPEHQNRLFVRRVPSNDH